jgi:hypothetical protein
MSDDALVDRTERTICHKLDIDLRVPQYAPMRTMFGELSNLSYLDDEDVMLGTVHIFRTAHHVQLVKVRRGEDGMLEGTCDPENRLEEVYAAGGYDGSPQTVDLPGFDGEWVVTVTPHR